MKDTLSGEMTEETPVLIAGAGPAGLATAITLARLGMEMMVVERRAELSSLPRATAVSLRSMELIRSWGVEDAVRAGAVDVEWRGWQSETLAGAAEGSMWPIGMPTREQAALLSPTAPACVPQDHLEPVLLEHLRSLGGARVHLHTEVLGVEDLPEGVEVVVRDVAGGAVRSVRARHLVAADGAHSRIRAALGIAMRGPDGLAHVVKALLRAPLWRLLGEHRYGIYSVSHPHGAGTFLPAGRGDRWTYGTWVEPQDVDGWTPERFVRRIRAGAGIDDLEVSIERTGAFAFAAQLADRFRAGNAFLVRDAAHRVTPRGGTGMNTAMAGGHDLGWKLGWVLRGWAGPDLLDTYEAERRPVAAHNVARSADPDGSTREAADELHVDLGGRIPHVWVRTDEGRTSTLDLLTTGLTLFTGPDEGSPGPPPAGGPPVTLRRLDAVCARAIGIRGRGALLVRPDGTPVRLWAGEEAAAARRSLRALARRSVAQPCAHDHQRLGAGDAAAAPQLIDDLHAGARRRGRAPRRARRGRRRS
jgi:putative polyketide hydroxylase